MEKKISRVYSRAEKDLTKKVNNYFSRFEVKDAQKKKLVEAGEMTQRDYAKWRQGQMMTGKHWQEMQKQVSQDMLAADKIAASYINDQLPAIYALNYNAIGDQINRLKGYSFELVDAATVRNLATSNKTLLPYKEVDGKKVVRWNTKKINSEVMQGILQGESVDKIAKRLEKNIPEMERDSAVRNARTTVTSAENKGRQDSYEEAEKMGIVVKKVWLAVHDKRTRSAHLELDGQEVDYDEPFVVDDDDEHYEIMYPGDPDADACMVYNCRCTMTTRIVEFKRKG